MSGRAGVRILVLEDDKSLSEILCEELRARGFLPTPAETVAEAKEHLGRFEFEVALLDLMLPDGSGIDVLRHVTEEGLATESIVLTGYAQVSTAIEAMKLGAYDYLAKPVRMEEVEALVVKAAEKAMLRRENLSLRLRLELQDAPAGIITQDPGMRTLLQALDKVAQSDLPVLVQGESGTGKELVARALHQRSERGALPFVAFNCAAVPDNLIESELFGYEKGAFTGAIARKLGMFELADRGVLFLDEIGDLSPAVQVKLLRAVEVREFFRVGGTRSVHLDVRIVSATNKNLKEASQAGSFREDLYFRLNGVTMSLPPLRDRKGDIALLATHFLKKAGGKAATEPGRDPEARSLPVARQHPGAPDGDAEGRGPGHPRDPGARGSASRSQGRGVEERHAHRPHPGRAREGVHQEGARREPGPSRPDGQGPGDRRQDPLQQAGARPAAKPVGGQAEGVTRTRSAALSSSTILTVLMKLLLRARKGSDSRPPSTETCTRCRKGRSSARTSDRRRLGSLTQTWPT